MLSPRDGHHGLRLLVLLRPVERPTMDRSCIATVHLICNDSAVVAVVTDELMFIWLVVVLL